MARSLFYGLFYRAAAGRATAGMRCVECGGEMREAWIVHRGEHHCRGCLHDDDIATYILYRLPAIVATHGMTAEDFAAITQHAEHCLMADGGLRTSLDDMLAERESARLSAAINTQ